jgi:lysophospholipase L1-like esterase
MSNQLKYYVLLTLLISSTGLFGQSFINEINAFRKLDSISKPPDKAILFIGSSSFTNWKDVAKYFPEKVIINRGFGGSSLIHLIMYANDVIFKYNPKQIVIYCGENDLTGGNNINADSIFNRYVRLHQLIRSKYRKVPIAYISMKPSISREKYLPTMQTANELIKIFLTKQKRSSYIDVYNKMIGADGKIYDHIFLKDQLHMNSEGYKIWQKIIAPYLID